MRRRGRLDVERDRAGEIVEPAEDSLVLLRGEHRQARSATDRYEEEDRPLHDPPLLQKRREPLELIDVGCADGGVDLERHALGARVLDAGQRTLERALEA